jgi:hypothetical protein
LRLSQHYWQERFDLQTAMLRNDIRMRGVEDMPADLYVQDSLALLEAIEQWVEEYTELFYQSDADVASDNELQAVLSEMHQLSSSSSVTVRASAIRGLPSSCCPPSFGPLPCSTIRATPTRCGTNDGCCPCDPHRYLRRCH